MTDDEVKAWLSMEERMRFESASADIVGTERNPVIAGLCRSLAETRKALAATEWGATPDCEQCFSCLGNRACGTHDDGCIFATMPRPR